MYNYFLTVLFFNLGVNSYTVRFNVETSEFFDLKNWNDAQEKKLKELCKETLIKLGKIDEQNPNPGFEITSFYRNK